MVNYKVKMLPEKEVQPILRASVIQNDVYSAAISEEKNRIYVPIKSRHCVKIFDLQTYELLDEVNLGRSIPDIALPLNKEEILIGCRDSAPPLILNNYGQYKYLCIQEKNFFSSSFKLSPMGKMFIGNLNGCPAIYTKGQIRIININVTSSYDCLWLSDDYLLISAIRDGKILLVELLEDECNVLQTIQVIYPYRFSPIVNNKTILTCRGWTDRPGKVLILGLSNIHSKQNINLNKLVSIEREIEIPDSLFRAQKILPEYLLKIIHLGKYNGYINDVAWVDNETFLLTTRTGNCILKLNLDGQIIKAKRLPGSVPTRFIGERGPNTKLYFIDAAYGGIFTARI